jgi:hypothetical protein
VSLAPVCPARNRIEIGASPLQTIKLTALPVDLGQHGLGGGQAEVIEGLLQ